MTMLSARSTLSSTVSRVTSIRLGSDGIFNGSSLVNWQKSPVSVAQRLHPSQRAVAVRLEAGFQQWAKAPTVSTRRRGKKLLSLPPILRDYQAIARSDRALCS